MHILVWSGATLALVGVAMLGWCIALALRIRRSTEDAAAARAALTCVLYWNMAALGIASMGLMAVVVGVILG